MNMSAWTVLGIGLVILLIIGVGAYSGKKIKTASDFLTGGGKVSSWIVCGSIMGALVSSQATIGTAQLAFHYGLSAWWFTLGSGIGCLVLALGYTKKMRKTGKVTEMEMISEEYGSVAGSLCSLLCCTGIFLSVLAQVIACSGLIMTLTPHLPLLIAVMASIGLMIIYVIFGGTWGAGMGGVIKLLLLYLASIVGLFYTLKTSNGISGLMLNLQNQLLATGIGSVQAEIGLPTIESAADVSRRFLNLVARGPMKDIGSGLSLLLGVLSTQTYAQAVLSARSDKEGVKGALLSAFLIPPLGIAGILIGLFMRSHYVLQAEAEVLMAQGLELHNLAVLAETIQVFPTFVMNHLNPFVAGIIIGTLLISVVAGGAGLSLGMATILVKNVNKKIKKTNFTPQYELIATRIMIAVILVVAAMISLTTGDTVINDYGFLSMGLRGAVVFVPLTTALYMEGRIKQKFILASIVLSPLAVIVSEVMDTSIDSLFIGVFISVVITALGYRRGERHMKL